jgi:hypothetical protein
MISTMITGTKMKNTFKASTATIIAITIYTMSLISIQLSWSLIDLYISNDPNLLKKYEFEDIK